MPLLRRKTTQAGVAPAMPGAPVAPAPGAQRTAGHVNLSELLGLNADKGAQMGTSLTAPIGKQAFDAKAALGQANANFAQQRQAGTVGYTAGRPKEEAQAQSQRTYAGPSQLTDVAPDVGTQVQNAAQGVQRVGSQSGRMSLLQQQNNQSSYGSGAQAFDAYLAGKGAEPQIQALQNNYGDLESLLGLSEQRAADDAAAARASSADAAGRYGADATAEDAHRLRSQSAGEDAALTAAHNADLRGKQGRDRAGTGDRLQQTSDLDFMLKSGRITQADYGRALDDPQFFQSLLAQHG